MGMRRCHLKPESHDGGIHCWKFCLKLFKENRRWKVLCCATRPLCCCKNHFFCCCSIKQKTPFMRRGQTFKTGDYEYPTQWEWAEEWIGEGGGGLAGETPYAAVEKNEHDNYAKLQSVADICHPRISFNKWREINTEHSSVVKKCNPLASPCSFLFYWQW